MDPRLPAVQPLVRERRDRAPVHGIAGGVDHRGGEPGARHGLHEREGPPARGRGAEKKAPGPSASPGEGRNTKIHVVSDSESTVIEIHLRPGNEHDAAHGHRSRRPRGTVRPHGITTRRRARGGTWSNASSPHEALPQDRHPLRRARRDLPRRPPAHPHRHLPKKHSQKPN